MALTKALDVVGTPVDFEVLKSIDGSDAESVVQSVYELQQRLNGLSFVKCTQSEYDNLTPAENTVYIIVG